MHWYGRFRAAFFEVWSGAGLPDPEPHLQRYRTTISSLSGAPPPPSSDTGPLHPELVARVYAFGEVVGGALGDLLGIEAEIARQRAEWCGRFNLGISLFDYVCDETGRGSVLGSIQPFAAFDESGVGGSTPSLQPEEMYLASLATDLIDDLRNDADSRLQWEPVFVAMYRAERAVADLQLNDVTELVAVRNALQGKSSEPFALMAAWMALGDPSADMETAVRLGRAVGNCYWIMDDASDLWVDIDAGNWNVFLVRAASQEPRLVTDPRTTLRDVHLNRVLVESHAAEKEATMVIEELVDALSRATGDPSARDQALGLVAASLAVW